MAATTTKLVEEPAVSSGGGIQLANIASFCGAREGCGFNCLILMCIHFSEAGLLLPFRIVVVVVIVVVIVMMLRRRSSHSVAGHRWVSSGREPGREDEKKQSPCILFSLQFVRFEFLIILKRSTMSLLF
jgi:uncharacterized membrane protein